MKTTIKTIAMTAVMLLSVCSCGNRAVPKEKEKNLFSDVAELMLKRIEITDKIAEGSLTADEEAELDKKLAENINELMDAAVSLGEKEIVAETDGDFGLTFKGPFKVFMFNRDNGCIYLLAPVETYGDLDHCFAIGYADETPEYYLNGFEEQDKDEEHMQIVMATGDDDSDFLQVKLQLRFPDGEQLDRVNKIVITKNEGVFKKLQQESARRMESSLNRGKKRNTEQNAPDDGNLSFMGISLGQSLSDIVAQLGEKGFKTVQSNKYMTEMQGDVYGKQASVTVETTDDQKIIISVRDLETYTLKQAQQRLDELQPHFQRDEPEEVLAFDTMEGVRLMQKGGKIDLYYYNEDEVEGTSDYYIVAVKLCNQDFTEE